MTVPELGWPFRELVGCLMRLANQTRPVISNAVRAVATYTCSPKEHWRVAAGILEYVSRNCSDFGINFQRGGGLNLAALANANRANKDTDRRSVSGEAITYAGACVFWFLRTQKRITRLRPPRQNM